ncbi:PadR family transcriptional regulator [Sphingomonas sp. 1P06PA]|uniref:PadR family transcriptional regulator n=1 Tax=Sphingomonas sp. 1P06PA TaxID=554121 RepID=UPI0039A68262
MEPGERGGGGRRRMFDSGELRLVLLKLIADQPRHGYDLIRAIEERTGGAYAPSPGVIYPTITLLEDMGLIAPKADDTARKTFAITADGTSHLADREAEVAALFARLDALGEQRERTDRAPVRRAMHNLKSALHDRLHRETDDDTAHEIAAILDAAAQKIERL